MVSKLPYTKFDGRYRPYLTTIFRYDKKVSPVTFALVDSGADFTVIPYSIGRHIGLPEPSSAEKTQNASGVGGNISYLERNCDVCIADWTSNQVYVFKEKVYWVYPDADTQSKLVGLLSDYKEYENLKNQCIVGSNLEKYFNDQMDQTKGLIVSMNNKFETGVLIGRPFFNNFEYIQFCQKDRDEENKCFFNYKVLDKKLIKIIPLQSVSSERKS